MKLYVKFLKKGFVYGKERVRLFCSAFYVVFTMPVDTPLLTEKRVHGNRAKRQSGYIQSGKKLNTPAFGRAFAV